MAKRKTYSREEAIAWMELGHKAKPAKWLHGEWIRLNKDGDFVDEEGATFDSEEVRQKLSRDGWLLLGKARMDREARIAELEAEAERLVEQRNDAMRKHDALADQLRGHTLDAASLASEAKDEALLIRLLRTNRGSTVTSASRRESFFMPTFGDTPWGVLNGAVHGMWRPSLEDIVATDWVVDDGAVRAPVVNAEMPGDEAARLARELAEKTERANIWFNIAHDRADELVSMKEQLEAAKTQAYDLTRALEKQNLKVHKLTKDLEAAKSAAPRFQVGDRVKHPKDGAGTIEQVRYWVNWDSLGSDAGFVGEEDLRLLADPKPEPEWHPCSAAEAREHHATGLRVRVRGCRGWLCRGSEYDRDGGQSNPNYGALRNLALAGLSDEWEWAEPLPDGGVS